MRSVPVIKHTYSSSVQFCFCQHSCRVDKTPILAFESKGSREFSCLSRQKDSTNPKSSRRQKVLTDSEGLPVVWDGDKLSEWKWVVDESDTGTFYPQATFSCPSHGLLNAPLQHRRQNKCVSTPHSFLNAPLQHRRRKKNVLALYSFYSLPGFRPSMWVDISARKSAEYILHC